MHLWLSSKATDALKHTQQTSQEVRSLALVAIGVPVAQLVAGEVAEAPIPVVASAPATLAAIVVVATIRLLAAVAPEAAQVPGASARGRACGSAHLPSPLTLTLLLATLASSSVRAHKGLVGGGGGAGAGGTEH